MDLTENNNDSMIVLSSDCSEITIDVDNCDFVDDDTIRVQVHQETKGYPEEFSEFNWCLIGCGELDWCQVGCGNIDVCEYGCRAPGSINEMCRFGCRAPDIETTPQEFEITDGLIKSTQNNFLTMKLKKGVFDQIREIVSKRDEETAEDDRKRVEEAAEYYQNRAVEGIDLIELAEFYQKRAVEDLKRAEEIAEDERELKRL